MKKEKIAFVVQRYGLDINGGAEYHCRVLAEHMTSRYQVDVLTSCAREYTPWDDYYDEGIEEINQVQVHRFSVDRIRDIFRFRDLTDKKEPPPADLPLPQSPPHCHPAVFQSLQLPHALPD